ncbi:DUF2459 domain-containing protein [Aquabacterium soli]|uniref:DUF2459 domain-containing protein n=1 Tax=Aquabacterium soli TaxID=2493092 RepID=A0A3R8S6W4_9BURK|nr:DUF2459 domain-containing protein [Aquabacterium soli]RRS02916.1 DUF2459 domain-containing protein [Aquabacterium soli]
MLLRTFLIFTALSSASAAYCADGIAEPQVKIYVVGNGWHAGLLLPAQAINTEIPSLRERFPQAGHYEIGWGDMGFYQAKDITVGLAIEALFFSKGSLLHVVGLQGPVDRFLIGNDVAQTCVSRSQYERMARLIAQAFVHGLDGKPVAAGPGLYGDGQFYKAYGRYSWLHTCNRWTAAVLQAGGVALSPQFSLTAGSVLDAVHRQGKCPAP